MLCVYNVHVHNSGAEDIVLSVQCKCVKYTDICQTDRNPVPIGRVYLCK